ncbi:UBX domain-containing protein 4 [Lamellibrachia satsuma]|nr:UBX domain-containing protein 4 [Lamellibrachia satsuma]
MCVPSTFFISDGGVPLEVTAGHLDADALVDKIEAVIQMHLNRLELEKDEQSQTPKPASEARAASTSVPSQQLAANSDVDNPLSSRVAKAKDLIAQKQQQKALKEKEEAKRNEKERRVMGQQLHQMRQQQADEQMKEDAENVKKDREEAKKARERVKAQIAQDRAERAARFQQEKAERDQAVANKQQARQAASSEVRTKHESARRESAVLQFRLPDGSSVTQQFPSSDTLAVARDFVTQHVGSSLGAFRLSTMFPKREFLNEHMSQTFLDLGLVPTSVVMILPARHEASRAGPVASSTGLLWTLLSPFLGIWNFISTMLFATPSQPHGSYNDADRQVSEPEPAATPSTQSTSGQRNRPQSSYGMRKRPQGNMHRLSADDSDEDNATWNGNSTQQL